MSVWTGPLLALASAASLGTSDFCGGLLSSRLRPIVVIGWSHALGFIALSLVCLVTPWSRGDWAAWAILAGVCSGLGMVAFYTALATGTMGVVAPIAALGTVIPIAWAITSGERPSGLQLVGIAVALVGAVLASGPEVRHSERLRARAVGLAALAALAFGVMFIAIIRGSAASSIHTMWGMRATSSAGYALIALTRRSAGAVRCRDVAACGGVGLLDLAGNFLLAESTRHGLVSVTVVLSALYPVATIALAAGLLRERLQAVQAAGVAVALVGVVLLNVPR